MSAVLVLHPDDNVAIALRVIEPATAATPQLVACDRIPPAHKIALRLIRRGDSVRKYGQVIGAAIADIPAGAHVHDHNVVVSGSRVAAPEEAPLWHRDEPARDFAGYRRAGGNVGTRNYIAVLTSVNCSATVARQIANQGAALLTDYPGVDGIVPVTHGSGCGMAGSGENYERLRRTIAGTARNPNFGGAILLGLGCEVMQARTLAAEIGRDDLDCFTIQDAGGTRDAIDRGLDHVRAMLPRLSALQRETVPASELVLGLQCGGSDGWSGVTANPALGNAADRLVALGGRVLLSETPEIFGAEHLLLSRARDDAVAATLIEKLAWWDVHTRAAGMTMNNNPSPGNKAGGLSTILEKSLGAVAKAGTSPLVDVIDYAAPVRRAGLTFMDSPGFDPCSATGQVASGATMIAFTTGRGSAYGCRPSPSIKLASNTDVYTRMNDDIDLNCGVIADGERTIEQMGGEILDYLLDVASGRQSRSEALGYGEAEFVPWLTGPIM